MSGAPAPTPIGNIDAVAYSRTFHTWKPKNRCANHVASCYSDGLRLTSFGIASAIDAWNKATQKVTDGSTPPPGAPVYWESGKWGHIAISVGGGRVRSTDYPVNEQLGECTIAEMGKRWPGMKYLGWSRDMAGRPIPGLEKKAAQVTPPKPAPNPAGDDMPTPKDLWNYPMRVGNGVAYTAEEWLTQANVKAGEARATARQALARVAALEASFKALAANPDITPEQVAAAAKAGAAAALAEKISDADVTFNVKP